MVNYPRQEGSGRRGTDSSGFLFLFRARLGPADEMMLRRSRPDFLLPLDGDSGGGGGRRGGTRAPTHSGTHLPVVCVGSERNVRSTAERQAAVAKAFTVVAVDSAIQQPSSYSNTFLDDICSLGHGASDRSANGAADTGSDAESRKEGKRDGRGRTDGGTDGETFFVLFCRPWTGVSAPSSACARS